MFDFSQIRTKYFWIAIIVIGTIGIWLPFLLGEEVTLKELSLLLTTYYISIYFSGCLDSVINKIKEIKNPDPKDLASRFLNIIALILLSIGLVVATILFNVNKLHLFALISSLIGTTIALILWWDSNKRNSNFFVNQSIISRELNESLNSFPNE